MTRKEGQSDGGMEERSGNGKEGQGIDKADTNGEDLAVVIDDDNEEEEREQEHDDDKEKEEQEEQESSSARGEVFSLLVENFLLVLSIRQ